MSIEDTIEWMDLLAEKYGISCPVTFETDEGDEHILQERRELEDYRGFSW
ncbi:hypothetical protein [Roseixanthobacter pseudopolyaromaticivorans]